MNLQHGSFRVIYNNNNQNNNNNITEINNNNPTQNNSNQTNLDIIDLKQNHFNQNNVVHLNYNKSYSIPQIHGNYVINNESLFNNNHHHNTQELLNIKRPSSSYSGNNSTMNTGIKNEANIFRASIAISESDDPPPEYTEFNNLIPQQQ